MTGRRACGSLFTDPVRGGEHRCIRETHGGRGVHRNGAYFSTSIARFRRERTAR